MEKPQASSLPDATAVVIVGAGPTGLALACLLAAERVPFVTSNASPRLPPPRAPP